MHEDVTMLDYRSLASTSRFCGTRRISDSYMKFRWSSLGWTDISERVYLNARALDTPYGI